MAIFGTLNDFSLPEVISLVRFDEGRLLLSTSRGPISLFIKNYNVLCAYQGVGLISSRDLVPLLASVAQDYQAKFQFSAGAQPPEPCPPPDGTLLSYPLRISTLLDHLERFLDGVDVSSDLLPHPDTRFILTEVSSTQEVIPPDLAGFVDYLSKPASAREIARRAGLPLEIVRAGLYRLRLREVIAPLESGSHEQISDPERKNFFSQLLKWLGGGGHWTRL